MLGTIIAFLILLFLSGFFSSAELAMMSLSELQVERLVKHGKRHAKTLQRLKQEPHKLLETILIGNNLVNITAASLATVVAIQLFGSLGVGIATGITTFLVLLFGEIIPKSLAVNHRKRISLAVSPILYGLQWLLTPLIIIIDWIASLFTRLFGEAERERITEEEVRDLVKASEQDGHIKKREREMIQGVLDLDDTSVEEVMTPRLDTFCLEMHERVEDVIDTVLKSGYSRIPVYDKKVDNVKGIVLLKDLLRALLEGKRREKLESLLQQVLVVPETKKLDSLLRDFQKRKSPFAIVVDEYGLFIGVVTIEDVLEELVGEIYDEDDADEQLTVKKVGKSAYRVAGRVPIDELTFGFPESEEYETLAGLLMTKFGRVPKRGEQIVINGWRCTVEQVERNRILSVRVER